jgi:hypothetical protein
MSHPRIRRKIQLTQSLVDAMHQQGDSYVPTGNLSFSDCVLICMGGYVPSPMTTPVLIRLATQYKTELQTLRNARQVRSTPAYLADSSLVCVDAFIQRVERDFDLDKNGAISLVILYASHIYKSMLDPEKERNPFQLTITGFDQAKDIWGMNVLLGKPEPSVLAAQELVRSSAFATSIGTQPSSSDLTQPRPTVEQTSMTQNSESEGLVATTPILPSNQGGQPDITTATTEEQDPADLSFDADDLLDAFSI